jgi:hypothetical protein
MSFRFRKSVNLGFGRVNLGKRGASLSVGGRGNVINLSPRGAHHTAGIPGTGLSWSHKLGGSTSRPARKPRGGGMSNDRFAAALAVEEAKYERAALAVHEMEAIEDELTPDQAAELAVFRAELNAKRIELEEARRAHRGSVVASIVAVPLELLAFALRLIRYGIMLLPLLFILWLLSHASAHAQSSSRSFYDERGSFAGSSVSRSKSTSFYDSAGRFSGSAIRYGNSTSFYDGRGRFTGSSINTGPRR